MLIATLLLSLAAEPSSDAAAPTVLTRIFPTGVDSTLPLNARPIAFSDGDGDDIAFLLHRGEQLETIAATAVQAAPAWAGSSEAHLLTLPELVVGETIEIESSCGLCVNSVVWTITDEVDEVAPAFVDDDYSASAFASGGTPLSDATSWDVLVELPRLVDDELLAWRLAGDIDGYGYASIIGDGVYGVELFLDNADGAYPAGRELCFDVTAIDVAGNESAPLPVCVPLERPAGLCTQASASTSASFGLLGLALLLVRRRSMR